MQRIENDPCDIAEFLARKGVQNALEASLLLEDKALDTTYLWSEPLLIASAMEVLLERGHQEDYELLGLHTSWEELLIEATSAGDELAASVCLDFIQ
jgi:hypothetical protein